MNSIGTHDASPARAKTGSLPVSHDRPAAPRARRRYGVLLLSSFLLLAVQGFVPAGAVQQIAVAALCGTSLVLAFRAADLGDRLLRLAVVLGALVFAATVIHASAGGISEGVSRLMFGALVALGPPAVALGVIRDLRTTGQVRVEAVAGVLSLYMLIGMLFAFVFGALDQLAGAPFFAGGEAATVSRCLYFSFVTLATVGYGDLVAASDVGRTLSIFEALLGQIYLVTVVSMIVSNIGRPARAERPRPAGDQ